MSCDGFCRILDDVGVRRVQRAILHDAQRGTGHEEDTLYVVMIIESCELDECNSV
jgi:hypothetical protein